MIRNFSLGHYLAAMLSTAYQFCLPTQGHQVPSGPDWLHEVKYYGYRIRVKRTGVRLITRGGNNWTSRYRG